MDYAILLNKLSTQGCKRILVTGAHRSGTTFASSCIALALGIPFYPEENIKGGSLSLLAKFQKSHSTYVLQAPGLSVNCHKAEFDAVIFMSRNTTDIQASMDRILSKRVIDFELARIKLQYGDSYYKQGLPRAKLNIFAEHQMAVIKNPMFLDYESLKVHRNWVEKEKRNNWHIRQINNPTSS